MNLVLHLSRASNGGTALPVAKPGLSASALAVNPAIGATSGTRVSATICGRTRTPFWLL